VYARTAKKLKYYLLTSIQTLIYVALNAIANAAIDKTLAHIFRLYKQEISSLTKKQLIPRGSYYKLVLVALKVLALVCLE
jgi:hypothetical protein